MLPQLFPTLLSLTKITIAVLRKKPVNPKMAMKPLYWTRIQLKTPKVEKPPESPSEPEEECDEASEEKEKESKDVEMEEKDNDKKQFSEVDGEIETSALNKKKRKRLTKR